VAKASPTIALSVSPNPVAAGTGAVGTATLAGAAAGASGTATYTIYADNGCSTPVTPSQSSIRTVSGAVVPSSAPQVRQVVRTVFWRVVYGGDANSNAATSACLPVTVTKAVPAVTLTISPNSISVWDSASAAAAITGATGAAGGSLVYTVYANSGCSVTATPAKTTTRTVANAAVAASDSFMFIAAGSVYWQASYSGDGNNSSARSMCVPLTVTSGNLSVSVASVTMAPVSFSSSDQTNTGVMTLNAVDRRGSSEGWSVSLAVSDFVYSGAFPTGTDIPADAFSIVTTHAPVYVQGQAISETGGPMIAGGGAAGPLDTAIVVLVASNGFGAGEYTQSYDVVLVIPAGSLVGTYVAVVDATTSAAP